MSQPNVSNASAHVAAPVSPSTHIFAYASLALGTLSLVCIGLYGGGILQGVPFAASFVTGAIGVVVGHLAAAQLRRSGSPAGPMRIARAGLALSYAGAILSLVLFALLAPVTRVVSYPSR